MGACCGHICPVDKLRGRFQRKKPYCDATSLVEFENLIDESPDEPRSISSWLSFGRNKLQRQEEALELEEETAIDARREASRMALLAQSPEIINPAKLAFSDTSHNWLGNDAHNWNVAGMSDAESPKDEIHSSHPLLSGSGYSFITNSTISSLSRDQRVQRTVGSTPPSSLDLEWENEAGLTPPPQYPSIVDDDMASVTVTDTTSNHSHRSTPASNENELEWDGDFASTEITHLDMETEQLISEIERMTENALKDTNSNWWQPW